MGAYMRTNGAVGARNVSQFMAGPYRVPHVKIDSLLWMTNKTPVGTYRGPGRFEANFFFERMVDMVAADLGIDRIEFRRKNLIKGSEQPYPIPHVQPTDAKYPGRGVVGFMEGGAAGQKESAGMEVNKDGTMSVYMGTSSVGRGVETVFAQIAADALEVPIDRIHQVYHG